jgi:hypothetical protein
MPRGSLVRSATPAVLAALVALSAALRFVAAHGVPTPWIAPDEMLYALLGRGLWHDGRLSVLGGDTPYYSLVYPAIAGLPLSLGSTAAGYTALKAVQAVLMSLTAVPIYLWGRSLVRPRWALVAAGLTLTIPGLAYAGLVMTEAAFFPLLVLAAWAAAAALERPTLAQQALLAGAVALAAATRLQALVLVPAVLTAILGKGVLDRELRRLRVFWPTAVAGIAALAWFALRGSSSLGGYAAAGNTSYGATDAVRYVLYHAADVLLLCGVVPACALALLCVQALRRPEPSAAVRAYLAVAVSFVVWLVVEVGVFASEHAGRIEERDLIGLAPLLFLALAVWLGRGSPRTYAAAATIAFAAAALVLLVPYGDFVTVEAEQDSFTFAAVLRLLDSHPGVDPILLIGAPAAGLAAMFALLPRRFMPSTVAVIACALVAGSAAASLQVRDASAERRALLLGPDPRWVDHAADGPTAYVFGGGSYWNAVWAHLFWNRRLDRVYDTRGAEVPGALPQQQLELRGDGVLRAGGRPIPTTYAVLPTDLVADGTVVARTTLRGSDQRGLALWRFRGTPRVLQQVIGLQPNGDLYAHATLRAYACRSGSFVLTLLGKTDATLSVSLDGRLVRTLPMAEGRSEQLVVSASPATTDGSVACTLGLRTTGVVGITQYRFARG